MRTVCASIIKSCILATPTLSTDADSGTDTNLKRKCDLSKEEEKKEKNGGGVWGEGC